MTDEEMERMANMIADKVVERLKKQTTGNGGDDEEETETTVVTTRKVRGEYIDWTEAKVAELMRAGVNGGEEAVRQLARLDKKSQNAYVKKWKAELKKEADQKARAELVK